ncbi:PHP domain-containing protein [Methanosphaerula palustris]|uniref:PHP domain protein n=1 Tax=Methanosphaerula palustris (strain ATCC BAA-1556 / DSM 19958 / E1-9c) TaxID=521011 RepID=B8GGE4_METPE|nr:PHP domain-containing protein [Methanosphaerula palustris]ACL16199.1 PHP domain protein [Methanosphaerula palustris E1-9c]
MKAWRKYSPYLLSGEWHIHTSYTDGHNSVDEYCRRAGELGIPLVAFTEHVRRDLNYDFHAFLDAVDRARDEYDLIILSGCEAKVLPGGTLDVDHDLLIQVDYPIFAFHSFPKDFDLYLDALYAVLSNPYVNAWAHPGLFLRKTGFQMPEDELDTIFQKLKDNDVLMELNKKYTLPPAEWINSGKNYPLNFVRGSDCHRVEEIG